jgi:hypothetical protein
VYVRPRDISLESPIDISQASRDATRVRREIARLFDGPPARRVVLAPGGLSALRHFFSVLGVERLALTAEEYYAPRHFPAITVTSTPTSGILSRVRKSRPQAVIVSVVSWRGEPLPVGEIFAEIRAQSASAPLLVADYTHAGAIGFPPMTALNADLVCGDPEKWLLPCGPSKLGFLWMGSPALFRVARAAFAPFFLAVDARSDPRSARWVDPLEVGRIARWLTDARLTRRKLDARHQGNLRMKQMLAETLGIDSRGDSSVIWTTARVPTPLRKRLESLGLIWRAGTHARILCRAEVGVSGVESVQKRVTKIAPQRTQRTQRFSG